MTSLAPNNDYFLNEVSFTFFPKNGGLWISRVVNNISFHYNAVGRKLALALCGFTSSSLAHNTRNQIQPTKFNIKVSSST